MDQHLPTLSGCTFIRNGIQLGFPFEESIRSLLPLVHEMIVVVGASSDETLQRIQAINDPKIRIIETVWNERMKDRGFVYAQQKMMAQYACTGDWVFYLEGDEILDEKEHAAIHQSLQKHHGNPLIEALVFDYYHFYGSPQWIATSPAWYRRECRIIRNTIRSYAPDGQYWLVAQEHRKPRYPRAALANAHIYHYGWVRPESAMKAKLNQVAHLWNESANKEVHYGHIDARALTPFQGSHPSIMLHWLAQHAAHSFAPDPEHQLSPRERKHRLSMRIESLTGWDLSRKHYRLLR